MNTWVAYALGVATTPTLVILADAVGTRAFRLFIRHPRGHSCYACNRKWWCSSDGSNAAITHMRHKWHTSTAHPGEFGRLVNAVWRGWVPFDHAKYKRLTRAYPNPRVTPLDIVVRVPLLNRAVKRVVNRKARKQLAQKCRKETP